MKVTMRPGVSVRAVVGMAEDGAALPEGLKVDLRPLIRSSNLPLPDGPLALIQVPPAEYWPELRTPKGIAVVSVSYNGRPVVNSTINVEADSAVEFVLTSQPGSITGMVRDANQTAVAGASVVLLPESLPDTFERFDETAIRVADSDGNGGFVFGRVAPGKYKAVALTGSNRERSRDLVFLRDRMRALDAVEVGKGQTATVEVHVP
jgi:hypothetical protein